MHVHNIREVRKYFYYISTTVFDLLYQCYSITSNQIPILKNIKSNYSRQTTIFLTMFKYIVVIFFAALFVERENLNLSFGPVF